MQNKLNKKINKKGISEVVAVVLIILISIVAISILFVVVRQQLDFSPQLSCTELQIKQVFGIKDACLDEASGKVITTLKRSFDDTQINSIGFTISFANEEKINSICDGPFGLSCGSDCLIPKAGETKKFYLDITGQSNPESLLIKANGCVLQNTEILPNC